MRPDLIPFQGEEYFDKFQCAFDELFPLGIGADLFGNRVIFTKDRCHHVCYKSTDRKWSKGERDQWQQVRAERIPWIKEALLAPSFVRITVPGIWTYMKQIERDKERGLSGELYAAIVQVEKIKPGCPGDVHFMSAYPVSIHEWDNWKKNKPWIFPSEEPWNTQKGKKCKQKQ